MPLLWNKPTTASVIRNYRGFVNGSHWYMDHWVRRWFGVSLPGFSVVVVLHERGQTTTGSAPPSQDNAKTVIAQ